MRKGRGKRKFLFLAILIGFLIFLAIIVGDLNNWEIVGDCVEVNDSNVFISTCPHTIKESGYLYLNITSKSYEGDMDLVLGFDNKKIHTHKIYLHNPYNITNSYECVPDFYNYTDSHFWCYKNWSNNVTYELVLIREGDYEWRNVNIFYWNVTEDWEKLRGSFKTINYEYQNMSRWYESNQEIFFESNKNYEFKTFIRIPRGNGFSPEKIDEKYWVGIKPDNETLEEAISNNRFYFLDPWVNSSGDDQNKDYLTNGSVVFFDFEKGGSDTTGYGINCIGNATHYTSDDIGSGFYTFRTAEFLNCSYSETLKINKTITIVVAMNGTLQLADTPIRTTTGFVYGCSGSGIPATPIDFRLLTTGGEWNQWTSGTILDSYALSLVGLTYDGAEACSYINGTQIACDSPKTGWLDGYSEFEFLQFGAGMMDNNSIFMAGIWNRSLNTSEMSDLWNSGDILEYSDVLNPDINIIYPINNTNHSNSGLNVNYTASDKIKLDNCWYSNDTMLKNTTLTNCGTNITTMVWSEGGHNVTIWANDTSNNINSSSVKFLIDTINPNATINQPTGTKSSLTVEYNVSLAEENDFSNCTYWIMRGASIEVVNTSIACALEVNGTFVVSGDASYVYWFFVNDTSGNANQTSSSFSVSSGTPYPSPPGGGGGAPPLEKTETICMLNNPDISSKTDLQRCVLYARIRDSCKQKLSCLLSNTEKEELVDTLEGQNVDIDTSEAQLWLDAYNKNKIEVIKMSNENIIRYDLFTGIAIIEELVFFVEPRRIDPFPYFLRFTEDPIFRTQVKAKKPLKSVEVLTGSAMELSVEITGNATADVILDIDNWDFSSRTYTGTISYVSVDDETYFQEVNKTVINFKQTGVWLFIVGGLGLLIMIFVFGKKIPLRKFKKTAKKVEKELTR